VEDLYRLADLIRGRGGILAGAGLYHGRLEVEAVALDEERTAVVHDAAANAARELRRQWETRTAQDREFLAFRDRLRSHARDVTARA
jgi:hypothetical protein